MRLKRIDVSDFRGFPGPSVYGFEFGKAQNMLLYGENGSGKSSLFRAIKEFFNIDWRAKDFKTFKNVFSDPGLTSGAVTVTLEDGTSTNSFDWKFGTARPLKGNATTRNVAIRLGCIDYRALLQTNFVHQGEKVNLFPITVEQLLAHHPVSVAGASTTVGELWERAMSSFPKNHRGDRIAVALRSLRLFNEAFAPIIPMLATKAEELLNAFPNCDFKLVLSFDKVSYDSIVRTYVGRELNLEIHSKGSPIEAHHHFLNEARLSAIALSIHLAGLLTSIPAPVPGTPLYPKILVLDDVLIGLDMSNRIPILDILRTHFSEWQIMLLTHDRVWAEIVRLQTQDDKTWCYHELYTADGPGGIEIPILKLGGEGANDLLNRARNHLANHDDRAAAVYARAAFEGKMKSYCEKKSVRVKYKNDLRRITAEDFWEATTEHALEKAAPDATKTAALSAGFTNIEVYRKIALNPLSHSAAAAITTAEIQGAIDAVANLTFEIK